MKKIILTVGVSSAGKTLWAEQYARDNESVANVNRDDIRFELFTNNVRNWNNYKFNKTNEDKVTEVQEQLVWNAAFHEETILISDTNLNPKIRNKWKEWAEKNNYEYEEKLFPCDWKTLVKRNAQRQGGLPESLLWDQYKRYMRQFGYYGGNKVELYQHDDNLDYTVIVDLDGTIASMEGIRKPFEWDLVYQDKVRHEIVNMVCAEGLKTGHITFLSGRDGSCYKDTKRWIEEHIMDSTMKDVSWDLVMRPEGDFRKDDEIKYELYNKHIKGKYNISSLFDDRLTCIRLWTILGIPNIIQVGEYNNEF